MVNSKKILTIHDLNHIHLNKKSARKLSNYIDTLSGYVSECNYVVAISKFVANDILTYIPSAKGKIKVIYNGADRLNVPENHKPVFDPGTPFLFTLGYVVAKKNFHVLPALLQGNNLVLVIAGIATAYKERIMAEAKKHHCEDRVFITGPISEGDKSWYYQNCDAFVFPSVAEGFGLPVIEAMNFGKPVFLSTHTSLPEIGGNAAFYFDNFDAESMQRTFAAGMHAYQQNKMKAEIIAHASQFSWQHTADQYLNLYADCLAG